MSWIYALCWVFVGRMVIMFVELFDVMCNACVDGMVGITLLLDQRAINRGDVMLAMVGEIGCKDVQDFIEHVIDGLVI